LKRQVKCASLLKLRRDPRGHIKDGAQFSSETVTIYVHRKTICWVQFMQIQRWVEDSYTCTDMITKALFTRD